MEHYLQVRDEHFHIAARKAVQNPVQSTHDTQGHELPAIATREWRPSSIAELDTDRQLLAEAGDMRQEVSNGPGGTRTHTILRSTDFKSAASANSATGPASAKSSYYGLPEPLRRVHAPS